MKKIAIIGGGAAGLAAAIAAGEACEAGAAAGGRADNPAAHANAKVDICIYDADERIGRTILATGNGRCNFSNAHIDAALYQNADFVKCALENFEGNSNGVVEFFEHHGMFWRKEPDGRLFPLANKASVVRDILLAAAHCAGVLMQAGCAVRRIEIRDDKNAASKFILHMADGRLERADAVIFACGGNLANAGSALVPSAISFKEVTPALCPLAVEGKMKQLDNIRVKAAVSLLRDGRLIARETGEVLFRKYGVSGIAVFNLSRFAQPKDTISIDFLPARESAELNAMLSARKAQLARLYQNLTCGDFMRGIVLERLADELLARCGHTPDETYCDNYAPHLAKILKSFDLVMKAPADVEHAQVHRGGVDVSEVDPRTMEVRACPDFYVVGEALDVDGPCGGYNLHWAFASGIVAGRAAAGNVSGSSVAGEANGGASSVAGNSSANTAASRA